MKRAFAIVAGIGCALAAPPSLADTEVLARVGAWQAFGGTTRDGQPVCGMSSSGNGRYFGIKYFSGDKTLTIQLGNKQWSLKDNIKVKVQMQFDRASPWNATGTGMHFGDGDAGWNFRINREQLGQFITEFRNAHRIAVRFPNDNVSDWNGSLEGTDLIANNFQRCMKNMP